MNQPQSVLTERPPVVADPPHSTATPTTPAPAPQDRCQECGSPMERQQRYCINCAARRNDVSNPASRYFAAASRQRRQSATRAAAPPAGTSGTKTAAVFFFALLPIAVAVGVIVGRSGSDGDNAALLAALREGNATAAVSSAGGGADTTENVSDQLLSSDFSLDQGFTVKLSLLPIEGTDQAAADDAVSKAEADGAKDVGIVNPGDYASTPDQGQKDYIVYSGEFKTKGEAENALGDLKKSFPDAEVIGLKSSAAGGAAGGGSDSLGGGQVVAHTSHGDVHEVTAEGPTDEQIQEGTDIVNGIASQTGSDYTDGQEDLPDVIPVGGDPDDAPPLPTGAGD
jgi:hypothetical protein